MEDTDEEKYDDADADADAEADLYGYKDTLDEVTLIEAQVVAPVGAPVVAPDVTFKEDVIHKFRKDILGRTYVPVLVMAPVLVHCHPNDSHDFLDAVANSVGGQAASRKEILIENDTSEKETENPHAPPFTRGVEEQGRVQVRHQAWV